MKKILIVDDEDDILEFLKYNLEKEGYKIFTASNGIEAIKSATDNSPDLILMDVMMPEMDGIEACRKLKEISSLNLTLIVFLSAKSEDYTQLIALEVGADDYIVKPVKIRLLIGKIKALFRRGIIPQDIITVKNISIDKSRYTVTVDGKVIDFPKKEFELLRLLAANPKKVLTRQEIYETIWGDDVNVGERTIDVHIRKIREKIGNDIIKTVKGIGYKFDTND
ncbi:MAG: DNA-binding response regulator [Bacteroidetes bacterium RIFOXYA12_FULL_35_11]|nr:MAG: DNA-binding response regulator [Bacteroidetes bacterium GWF2_35_48]OFY74169.1 MAG: DNA-binding response regulator [Bacteroidetes bacterium RIFOXYA12_FULL_35_11]OFY93989.1 MAG: DNA-binding response regulator [Bacteroidetes bacterium RIFOXYC12_FULL_35_7]OFY94122.1 MAG: DNA-binding response regulator [Bacteroidetes bacterium RIFOXYB2_FULL_35_7]HBX51129.1 DNA-binding response regulator [Bacteroidales bacterium]